MAGIAHVLWFKLVIVTLLLFIVGSLFTALYFLARDTGDATRIVKSLGIRIGLSLLLMGLLFVGIQLGLIEPHDFGR